MSGLVKFFQKFMSTPPLTTTKKADSSVVPKDDEVAQYGISLLEIRGQNDDSSVELDDSEQPEYTENVMDFQEWRRHRNEILDTYCSRRMLPKGQRGDDDDDDNDEEGEDMEEQEEEETPFSQSSHTGPETQQTVGDPETQDREGEQQLPSALFMRKRKRKTIPHHLEDTVHDVELLDDVDLYTREASFNLCQVTKVFECRSCKRFAATSLYAPRYRPMLQSSDGSMVNISNTPVTDDGPLCTVYKTVLNMEVQQLENDPPSLARQAAAAGNPDDANYYNHYYLRRGTSRHKMRIFFYNQCAQAIQTVLEEFHPKTHLLLMNLKHVPAACIFPHVTYNWYDQQVLSGYCICIGGPSSMKMDLGGGMQRTAFDSSELQLRFAIGERATGTFREFLVRKDERAISAAPVEQDSTGLLSDVYKNWREVWQLPPFEAEATKKTQGRNQEQEDLDEDVQLQTDDGVEKHGEEPPADSTRQQQQVQEINQPRQPSRVRSPQRQPAGLPIAKRAKQTTKYVKLSELKSILDSFQKMQERNINELAALRNDNEKNTEDKQCEVNLFGLVVGFSAFSKTKRGDWMLCATLVDESISPDDQDGKVDVSETRGFIPLCIFVKDSSGRLPSFRSAGDVLRLHRVVVQYFNGELQLLARQRTGYTVYHGHSYTRTSVDREAFTSPTNYGMTPDDEHRFYGLWKWGQSRLARQPTIKASEVRTLEKVRQQDDNEIDVTDNEEVVGDYTLMISDMVPMPLEQRTYTTPAGFLRVWDGTGFSSSDRMLIPRLSNRQTSGEPPSEALVNISKIEEQREGYEPLQHPKRLCGRIINVAVWENPHWELLKNLENVVGRFFRFRNVREEFHPQFGRHLCLHGKSWLTPLPNATFEVFELLVNHGKRVANRDPFNPNSGVLPLNQGDSAVPSSPEMADDVYGGPVTALGVYLSSLTGGPVFEGTLHVKSTVPPVASPADLSRLCASGKYRFVLTLSDDMSEVDVLVSDAIGTQFFGMDSGQVVRGQSGGAWDLLSNCVHHHSPRRVKIRRTYLHNRPFFILLSISAP